MRNITFISLALLLAAVTFGIAGAIDNAYVFFAGYVVLQYIVLATAWNILGGYTGYVNFGTAAFFALGAYTTVVLHKTVPVLPLPAMMQPGRWRPPCPRSHTPGAGHRTGSRSRW